MKANYEFPQCQELGDLAITSDRDFDNIKHHLALVFLALEAIADISSEVMIQEAKNLNLESLISDQIILGRSSSWSSQDKDSGEYPKFNIEHVKALVTLICHLAAQHQELLRRAVSLLEQASAQNQSPLKTALLGNYCDRFIELHHQRIAATHPEPEILSALAWKLLISLLFYSGNNGRCLLWAAIFE